MGYGACTETSAIAFYILTEAGFKNVKMMECSKGHAFTVFGLPENANPNNPGTWGRNARVADGWMGISMNPQEAFGEEWIFNSGQNGISDRTDKAADMNRLDKARRKFNLYGYDTYTELAKAYMRIRETEKGSDTTEKCDLTGILRAAVKRLQGDPDKVEFSETSGYALYRPKGYPDIFIVLEGCIQVDLARQKVRKNIAGDLSWPVEFALKQTKPFGLFEGVEAWTWHAEHNPGYKGWLQLDVYVVRVTYQHADFNWESGHYDPTFFDIEFKTVKKMLTVIAQQIAYCIGK